MGKRVLICPLDWGLGHATRCVPVIRELLRQGAIPLLGGSGPSLKVLEESFPDLPLLKLPSYGVRYPGNSMVWNMAWQLPRIACAVWKEHYQLRQWIDRYQINGVISDHRYGCFSPALPSIIIAHQLHLILPGLLLPTVINRLHHYFIRHFDACWIPDLAGKEGLAGKLSHPSLSEKDRYIGWLSRLEKRPADHCYDILLLLSGPEPQRTRLEVLLLEQAKGLPLRCLLVRGIVKGGKQRWKEGPVEVVSYLPAGQLSASIAASDLVVCRSGYSTLMDLARLGKRAILIPTPGQTEQEYLARHLYHQGICLYGDQESLDLRKALEVEGRFSGFSASPSNPSLLREAVAAFLERL